MFEYIVELYPMNMQWSPIRHVFVGNTQAEAWDWYQKHLRYDAALSGCVERGMIGENEPCRVRAYWNYSEPRYPMYYPQNYRRSWPRRGRWRSGGTGASTGACCKSCSTGHKCGCDTSSDSVVRSAYRKIQAA